MKLEPGIGVTLPQAKDCQEPPETEGSKERFFSGAFIETMACEH